MNSREVGNIGLGRAIAWFTREGYQVAVPLTDSQPYDLVVEKDGKLFRVSVKYTNQQPRGIYTVGIRTVGQNSKTTKVKRLDKTRCELLFVCCSDDRNYLIPVKDIEVTNELSLGPSRKQYEVTRV